MSLSFFADQCVPREIESRLRAAGHDVVLLRDALPKKSPDLVVIAKAQELDAVLSLNGDFSDIVTYPPSVYKGIISIQLQNHPEVIPQLMDRRCDFIVISPRASRSSAC